MLQTVSVTTADVLKFLSYAKCNIGSADFKVSENCNIQLIPPLQEHVLNDNSMEDLKAVYKVLYPELVIECVFRVTKHCFRVSLCGEIFHLHLAVVIVALVFQNTGYLQQEVQWS